MKMYNRYSRRGFTLVELMMVIALIGILATLAIYGVRRFLSSARTAEAKNAIGAISRCAQSAYERQQADSLIMADAGTISSGAQSLCGDALPVPDSIAKVAGAKYQPQGGKLDFFSGDDKNGWFCLRFGVSDPISYQYWYTKGAAPLTQAAGAPPPQGINEGFEAGAKGDTDNDNVPSYFALHGVIVGGQLKRSTAIFISANGDS